MLSWNRIMLSSFTLVPVGSLQLGLLTNLQASLTMEVLLFSVIVKVYII